MSAIKSRQMLDYFNQLDNTEQQTILQMLQKILRSGKKMLIPKHWKNIQKNWNRQIPK